MSSQRVYNAGIYLRLSRDDNNGSESMSIANQRDMLTEYVQNAGFKLYSEYVDDGFSGVNFQRPSFKRMIADAELGLINCIVTKDLSRLGRNYVQTGYYTEEYFIERDIRFIAVNDSIDTLQENNDIAAFHHVLNEFYPKQVSKKVRQVKRTCAQQGKFIGSQAPYGFVKSPVDKHLLVPDNEAASVIQRIFRLFADGESGRHIADMLNTEGVLAPAAYHDAKSGKAIRNTMWGSSTVLQLLRNQAYIGNMAQGKRKVLSFKTKKRMVTDRSDWIIVENTHEPLIDLATWNSAQARLTTQHHSRVTKSGELSLFSGIAECANCGAKMAFTTKQMSGRTYQLYRCSTYNNQGKGSCSIHSISLETLSAAVLEDIQTYAKLAADDENALLQKLSEQCGKNREQDVTTLRKKLNEAQNRNSEIEKLALKLFEEHASGNVPDGLFKKLMNGYEDERVKLETEISGHNAELALVSERSENFSEWLDILRKYVIIDSLDRNIVTRLIDKITVSEVIERNGSRQQDIKIFYKFAGCLS
jgi:DNA invertase Pin-like site-specific DNA recombinase